MDSKDIRYTEKKVDESWKDQASREKSVLDPNLKKKQAATAASGSEKSPTPQVTSKAFLNLISSLGYQAMFHLGEIADPQTGEAEINLEAAREVIDLLTTLKEKTAGNLSAEENQVLTSILPELQLKYSQKA